MDNTRAAHLTKLLTAALFLNELDNNAAFLFRFSDADGVRTGKSGYSFGLCQFDIMNNIRAVRCLKECGFSEAELLRLRQQLGPIEDLNAKLLQQKAVVNQWDAVEISHTVRWVDKICTKAGIIFQDDAAFIHACDYHNQYDMKANGKAVQYLKALKRLVISEDILNYKLTTIWGKKRPDDVHRRFDNIVKIMGETP